MKGPINFSERIHAFNILVCGDYFTLGKNPGSMVEYSLWIKPTKHQYDNAMFIHFDWENEQYQVKFAPKGSGSNFNNIFGKERIYKTDMIKFEVFITWLYHVINEHKNHF